MQEHFLRSIYRTGGIYRFFVFLFFFYFKRRQELLDVVLCNDKVNEGKRNVLCEKRYKKYYLLTNLTLMIE